MAPKTAQPSAGGNESLEAARWARIKAVFLQSLEYPEDARAVFLDDACAGDPELRRELDSLLASAAAADGFCETPAGELLERLPLERPSSQRLPAGTRLGPYEITSFIAAGGMGVVYLARHTTLGRVVALKTVASANHDEAAARRLVREARSASILAHPNICTVYEVGESAQGPFIAMEYVPGQLLSERVWQQVPQWREAVTYGIQIADALAHAHGRGIIHRDLKSSNIVVAADGRPVILDFGLARRLAREDESVTRHTTITAHDALAGTLSHMAPEVLLGGTPDARSDVWALGVVLYELVSGELPFKGRTAYETSSAILDSPPRPLRGIPLALRLVIERCLAKDPGARYQSAADVRHALDAIRRRRGWPLVGPLVISLRRRTLRIATGMALLLALLLLGGRRITTLFEIAPRVSTMAVLPLANGTGDPADQYYADGFTDGLIAQLSVVTHVRIIPRPSASRFLSGSDSRAKLARQLRADVLVEGALRRADDRVVVDLRLIEPVRGRVLWSDTYERRSRDVLALQADAVQALAVAMRLAVRTDAADRLAAVRAVNPAAYEEYLKGRYEWNQRTPRSLERAIAHFTRATELDPTFAPAHAALADCYNLLGTVMVSGGSPSEWRPRAAAAAIKALQLDPYAAEAHAALGYVRHYEWRWSEAERAFRRALELNPSSSMARIWFANLLMSRGHLNEALKQVHAARELDPFSLIVNTNVGWVLTYARRYQDAIRQLQHTLELDSTYVQARQRLAGALRLDGRLHEATREAERVVALTDSSTYSLATLATIHAHAGRPVEARRLVAVLQARAQREYVPPWSYVHVHCVLGDIDTAAYWTEKAYEEGSNGITYLMVDPELAELRQHPRVRAVLAAAGFIQRTPT